VARAGHVAALADDDRVGLLLSVEGAEPWEADDVSPTLRDLGVRMAGLT
jgi:microsomal dipeptidase-like Zn-dependent dipeptidase